jgi:hypothetical protein
MSRFDSAPAFGSEILESSDVAVYAAELLQEFILEISGGNVEPMQAQKLPPAVRRKSFTDVAYLVD